jgi:hypothetical protein
LLSGEGSGRARAQALTNNESVAAYYASLCLNLRNTGANKPADEAASRPHCASASQRGNDRPRGNEWASPWNGQRTHAEQPAENAARDSAAGRGAISAIEPYSGREPSDLQLHSNDLERLVTNVLRVVDSGIHVNDLTSLAAKVFRPAIRIVEPALGIREENRY